MNATLEQIKGIDIYLLDQFFKERINSTSKILDAGCGSGRNIHWLIDNGYNVSAFDPKQEQIDELLSKYPKQSADFKHGTIEDQLFSEKFDFIICNAVLHFAENHQHFNKMMLALVNQLAENGILFIRMTTNIGLEEKVEIDRDGRAHLADNTGRYLCTRKQIESLKSTHKLKLIEPVKSLKVEDLRTMSTIVFQKQV